MKKHKCNCTLFVDAGQDSTGHSIRECPVCGNVEIKYKN